MGKRIAAVITTSLTLIAAANAYTGQVIRTEGFQEFSITSEKTGRTMPSSTIEPLVCQPTTAHMSMFMDLIQNFDLLGTKGDGTASMTMFAGTQNGKRVNVTLWVNNTANNKLSVILINNEPALKCSLL